MLERARAAGVETLLAIGSGTGPERLNAAIPFAEQHDWIYATVGIHPHEAKLATEEHFAKLDELAKHPRVIALGRDGPRLLLRPFAARCAAGGVSSPAGAGASCEAADHHSLPRRMGGLPGNDRAGLAFERTGRNSSLLHRNAGRCEARAGYGVHGFVCRECDLQKNAEFAGCGERNSARAVADGNRFAISSAEGRRGKRNEPANVVEVARALGNVRDLPSEEVAAVTAANFRRFFRLDAQNQVAHKG